MGRIDIKPYVNRLLNLLKWLVVPGQYGEMDPGDIVARRKKNTRYLIIGATSLFILLTVAAILMQDSGVDAPISNDLAVALVLNLNVILLVVMVLLVIRNLVKLYFERRGKIAGARFQTKLVISFLAMTLVPSALMFTVASELISDTVDKWLNARIERTLQESLLVAESLYRESEDETRGKAQYLSTLLDMRGLITEGSAVNLNRLLRQKLREYNVDLIQAYNQDFELVSEVSRPKSEITFQMEDKPDLLARVAVGETVTEVDDKEGVNMVISLSPIADDTGEGRVKGVVVVAREVTRRLIEQAHSITKAFEDYKQLKIKKELIKTSYQVTLLLVALVIMFSSIWIGFYLARGITVPLKTLSEAAEAVARGDLNVRIDTPAKNDEVGQLITSFNNMTHDLSTSKGQLEEAMRNLTGSNVELHHWGQYIEAVLENVPGGVVSIDKAGMVTTINDYAAAMFGVPPGSAKGKNYRRVFGSNLLAPIKGMIREMRHDGKNTVEQELDITVNGQRRALKTSVSMLQDRGGQYMGMVIVFNDLTDFISAQRALALKEMARVVAHEIKNPLTPIQLNAQRMRRKFEQKAPDFPKVFDDATNTIIREVEQMKGLVEQFSRMAKMSDAGPGSDTLSAAKDMVFPDPRMEPCVLHDTINGVINLYKHTRQGVSIQSDLDPAVNIVRMDPEQMKRVFINLVDNAMDALNGEGNIVIKTRAQPDRRRVQIQVEDTGHGVVDGLAQSIFKPYFSTKPSGAGLGLAIVNRVVEDHGGSITVSANRPRGTVFTVELPVE
ncbi:MAG: HAMP domain-containing protein [Nitrospinae bacterium]|nr:HAMP domain-containing protein [Nitrospinota bacterium]